MVQWLALGQGSKECTPLSEPTGPIWHKLALHLHSGGNPRGGQDPRHLLGRQKPLCHIETSMQTGHALHQVPPRQGCTIWLKHGYSGDSLASSIEALEHQEQQQAKIVLSLVHKVWWEHHHDCQPPATEALQAGSHLQPVLPMHHYQAWKHEEPPP